MALWITATRQIKLSEHVAHASIVHPLTGNARLEWRHRQVGLILDVTNLADAEWIDASGQIGIGNSIGVG